jgi:hypothetical protein
MARGWHEGIVLSEQSEQLEFDQQLLDEVRAAGLADDPRARQLVGRALVLDAVAELTNRRVGQGIRIGAMGPNAGAVPSLMAARTAAWRTAVISELFGPAGVAAAAHTSAVGPGGASATSLDVGMSRVMTHRIGGGTLETQLNGVAERFLELPREPAFDRDVPFNQIRRNAMPGVG